MRILRKKLVNMFNKKPVGVIIPCYNEEGKIGRAIKKLPKDIVDEIVVIDDGSTDNTYNEAKITGVTVLKHEKNLGVGAALRTGFKYIVKRNHDICIQFGGDDQLDSSQIPEFLEKIKEGADVVLGSRYLDEKDSENMPLFRSITTKLFSRFFSFVAGKKITDASNGYIVFKTEILKNINLSPQWLNRYELEPYMLLKVIEQGYKVIEIPSNQRYDKKFGYSKMIPLISWWQITKPLFMELPKVLFKKLGGR